MLSLRLPGRARRDRLVMQPSSLSAQTVDYPLLWVVATLLLFGLVMVYSASIALPDSARFSAYRPTYFLTRHAIAIVLGVCLGLVAFAVPVLLSLLSLLR